MDEDYYHDKDGIAGHPQHHDRVTAKKVTMCYEKLQKLQKSMDEVATEEAR